MDYDDLPLPAQLNVDADEEAKAFHTDHAPTLQEHAPVLPTTKVHPTIDNRTTTGHYRHSIWLAASLPDVVAKIKDVHQWTDCTYEQINIPAFRSSVRANYHQHEFVFKWTHKVLPTQECKSKWEFCASHMPQMPTNRRPKSLPPMQPLCSCARMPAIAAAVLRGPRF
jgi:hypothetical protein